MLSDSRELRAYIWYYCCRAVRASTEAPRTLEALREVLLNVRFPAKDPNIKEDGAGYVPAKTAVWVRPYNLQLRHQPEDEELDLASFLYGGRPLATALRGYVDTRDFVRWLEGERRPLTGRNAEALLEIGGEHGGLSRPYDGVVLLGSASDRGVVWIGVRATVAYARLSAEAQSRRLQVPETSVGTIILPSNNASIPPTDVSVAPPEVFGGLCLDLLSDCVHQDVVFTTPSSSEPMQWKGSAARVVARSEAARLPEWIAEAEAERRDRTYVVLMQASRTLAEEAVFDALVKLRHVPRIQVAIVAAEDVTDLLRHFPWLWSKYFGNRARFAVVHANDGERLQQLLLPSWTPSTREFFHAHVDSTIPRLMSELVKIQIDGAGVNDHGLLATYRYLHEIDEVLQTRLIHRKPDIDLSYPIERAGRRFGHSDSEIWQHDLAREIRQTVTRAYDRAFFPIVAHHGELYAPVLPTMYYIRINGRALEGKSTLLYQRLRLDDVRNAGIVVLGSRARQQRSMLVASDELKMLVAMIEGLPIPWVVAIENLDLEKGSSPKDTTLAVLLDLATRINPANGVARLRIFATVPSEHDDALRVSYGQFLGHDFDLRKLDVGLIAKLIDEWILRYDITISTEVRSALQERFSRGTDGKNIAGFPCIVPSYTIGDVVARLRANQELTVTLPMLESIAPR
jgi:hypothetical protein